MLLGRPTMINDRHCTVTMPVDCETPADFTSHEPTPRGIMDPPSSFTQRILDYHIAHLINEVEEITQDFNTTSTPDFVRLEALHAKLMGFTESFPPEFSITNRNTIFDNTLPFLAVQAALLKSTFYSAIIALHRPYLFLREKSRKEIVHSALIMLECQDIIIKLLQEHHHRLYAICFFTFDPCVLLSAIMITNSNSMDQATLDQALISLRAGWKRLRILGVNVKLAEKGAVVLRVLLRKVEVVAEGLRRKNTSDEAGNESVDGRGKSARPRSGGGGDYPTSSQRNINSTRGNSDSRRMSPSSYRLGRQTPEHSSTCSSPSELDHSNSEILANHSLPPSTYLDALNAASSFGRHHHQQHQTRDQPTVVPLEWDCPVLIDLPINHMDTLHIHPTTRPVIPDVRSTTPFGSTKSTWHQCHGEFPGFLDGTPAFPIDTGLGSGTSGMDDNDGITERQTQDWEWRWPVANPLMN